MKRNNAITKKRNNAITKNERTRNGFTYVELLITLAIIAIVFIPIMRLFSHTLYSTSASQELITATNLAKWQLERTKNLNVTKAQLREMGNEVYPLPAEEPIELNGLKWRIIREIVEGSDPLDVRVHVYRDKQMDKPIVTLVTLIEDTIWEEVIPVK